MVYFGIIYTGYMVHRLQESFSTMGGGVYSAPMLYNAPDKGYELKFLPNITLCVYFEVILK